MGVCSQFMLLIVLPAILEARKLCFQVEGLVTPVFTPMFDDGRMNLGIIPQYAQFLRDKGMDGVLVAGTTGEGPVMNETQRKNLIDAWVKAAGSLGLTVTIQVGGAPRPDVQDLARYSEEAGADAIMTLPELYYRPETPEDLADYVQLIARCAPNTPVLYYHKPDDTRVNVDLEVFWELATDKIPNFKGMKTEEFDIALQLQSKLVDDQKIFIADSRNLGPALLMGFTDFILAEMNFLPTLVKEIVEDGKNGDLNATRAGNQRLAEISDTIIEGGKELASLKAAMAIITGLDMGPVLPHEIPLTPEEENAIELRLEDEDIENADYKI